MNEQNFVCVHCSKRFSTKFSLQRHTRTIHEGEKGFICQCSKSFGTMDQLRRHRISKHSNERPFKCSYEDCGRAFGSKNALMYHYKNSHEPRQFECPLHNCGEIFQKFRDLKGHLHLPHSIQPEERYEETSQALKNEIGELKLMKKKFFKKDQGRNQQLEDYQEDAEQEWLNLLSEL